MQYGQNISIPYTTQTQSSGGGEHNFLNSSTASSSTPTAEQQHNKTHKNQIKMDRDREDVINQQILQNVNQSWQTLANPGNTVDYSSHLLTASLPITIQHFLKYSETIKKETVGNVNGNLTGQPLNSSGNLNLGGVMDPSGFNIKSDVLNLKNGLGGGNLGIGGVSIPSTTTANPTNTTASTTVAGADGNGIENNVAPTTTTTGGKKKKKKPPKEKKPRPKPGEIRETKALDGSTLFCCPECQMAYPDRSLIEQHVISHAVERRFVCDICNAALKRKDHLTRHKLSHIPDRPHVCNVSKFISHLHYSRLISFCLFLSHTYYRFV